jgi:hypothetical protein
VVFRFWLRFYSPGVETPGYRLKPALAGCGIRAIFFFNPLFNSLPCGKASLQRVLLIA